jgi:tRNA threonylcarbamoyladenosine modification (KEOPS) complex  Pcc1 subunit
MTKNDTNLSHSIIYDNIHRVVKLDAETIKYRRPRLKLYCYMGDSYNLYISARDYQHAISQLDLIFTKII